MGACVMRDHIAQKIDTEVKEIALIAFGGCCAAFSSLRMNIALAAAAKTLQTSPMAGGEPSYVSRQVPKSAKAADAHVSGAIGLL